ncbi:MAG: FeoB-associated Cys-rich membrane protein [Lachnospiraceae bacterium]|nr:FeoB-associated Cys-rich membrane protein [Lachnospiraceae bacterium]
MISWLLSNIWTIVISVVLLVIVSLIIVKLVKDRKNGRSSCGCGCEGCSMNGSCNKKTSRQDK